MDRRAAAGFALVALAQLCYLVAGLAADRVGLGTLVDGASAACALACAVGASRSAPRLVAGALSALAAVQLADFASTVLGGGGPFLVGFVLVVAGLCAAAVASWRGSARGLRWGAGTAAAGSASYIVLGVLLIGLTFSLFTLGALAATFGWLWVAALG
jgi:hypothetical protein